MYQKPDLLKDQKADYEFINLKKIIAGKDPLMAKLLPKFILNYLNRILHVKEVNASVNKNRHLTGLDFVNATLEDFQIRSKLIGEENIPVKGKAIVCSNHPLGGPDGLALITAIGKYRTDVKFIVNDFLLNVDNLKPLFIPVNKIGANSKEYILLINALYESDNLVLNFPFGLVSRKRHGIIMDLEWKKSFITKAKQHKRNIIPAYIDGRNSNFFYNLANLRKFFGIKINIEMLYLIDEMYKHKDIDIVITFGTPIPYQTFDNRYTDSEWAEKLRKYVYLLANDYKTPFIID